MPDIEQITNYIGYVFGGLAVGGYTVHRLLKRDSNSDKIDSKTQFLIDYLKDQLSKERESATTLLEKERAHAAALLEKERAHGAHLGTVIDRISLERNEAVQSVGSLKTQIQAMGDQINRLQTEVQRQETINLELSNSFSELKEEVIRMTRIMSQGESN